MTSYLKCYIIQKAWLLLLSITVTNGWPYLTSTNKTESQRCTAGLYF